MDNDLFKAFAELTFQETGITLKQGRETMLGARISRRMRELGLGDPREYLEILQGDPSGEERRRFINSITTNTTRFFRESPHFDAFAQAVRGWVREGRRNLRVWCAASSTGEEPYTIAMTLLEAMDGRPGEAKILATDIDTRVLATAKQGVYSSQAVSDIPKALRDKYLERIPTDAMGERYRMRDEVRKLISFGAMNLVQRPYPMKGPFDVVFIRNVMIYFNTETRAIVINEIARLMRPEGLLFVGHSESLAGCDSRPWTRQGPSSYVRRSATMAEIAPGGVRVAG